jgi:hypothetical protein
MQIVTNFLNNSKSSLNISFEETKQTINLTIFILSIFLSCFCLITVFGNALVIYAVIQERYLKSGIKEKCLFEYSNEFFPQGHHSLDISQRK